MPLSHTRSKSLPSPFTRESIASADSATLGRMGGTNRWLYILASTSFSQTLDDIRQNKWRFLTAILLEILFLAGITASFYFFLFSSAQAFTDVSAGLSQTTPSATDDANSFQDSLLKNEQFVNAYRALETNALLLFINFFIVFLLTQLPAWYFARAEIKSWRSFAHYILPFTLKSFALFISFMALFISAVLLYGYVSFATLPFLGESAMQYLLLFLFFVFSTAGIVAFKRINKNASIKSFPLAFFHSLSREAVLIFVWLLLAYVEWWVLSVLVLSSVISAIIFAILVMFPSWAFVRWWIERA